MTRKSECPYTNLRFTALPFFAFPALPLFELLLRAGVYEAVQREAGSLELSFGRLRSVEMPFEHVGRAVSSQLRTLHDDTLRMVDICDRIDTSCGSVSQYGRHLLPLHLPDELFLRIGVLQ